MKLSQAKPFPPRGLRDAERVAGAIRERNAGKPMDRLLVADALGTTPSSSGFRALLSATHRWGLTTGTEKADQIGLTAVGEALTAPRSIDERTQARAKAFLSIPLFAAVVKHFEKNRLPEAAFLKNTLERPPFDVAAGVSAEAASMFVEEADFAGFLRPISGSTYVFGTPQSTGEPAPSTEPGQGSPGLAPDLEFVPGDDPPAFEDGDPPPDYRHEESGGPRAVKLFIGHGTKKDALRQLEKILIELKIPYVVAEDEPHRGRPISQKVAEAMRECTAGVFVFTPDDELFDKNGDPASRPRENVVFELGAASLIYGRQIVIFKEKSVKFATDFQDLGYIEFEGSNLQAKSLEFLRELIALGAVQFVTSAAS